VSAFITTGTSGPWWGAPVIAGVFLLVGVAVGAFATHRLTLRRELASARYAESRELNSEGRKSASRALLAAESFGIAAEAGVDVERSYRELVIAVRDARSTCSSRLAMSAESMRELAVVVARERSNPDGDLTQALERFFEAKRDLESTMRIVMRLGESQ